MSSQIRVTGNTVLPWGKISGLVPRGLAGLYKFGGTEGWSAKNHANPALPLRRIGSPVLANGYARCTGNAHYYEGTLPETAAVTIAAVARMVAVPANLASGGCVVGTYAGAGVANLGVSLYADNPGSGDRWRMIAATDNGGTAVSAGADADVDTTQWALLVGSANTLATQTELHYDPGALSVVTDWIYPRAAATARSFRIGSAYSSLSGQIDINCAAIWTTTPTAAELALIQTQLRALAASDGIVV